MLKAQCVDCERMLLRGPYVKNIKWECNKPYLNNDVVIFLPAWPIEK